ncbi:MAG: 3-methyl-2-oxobutanoate hydroxymethyltransferase [Bdellovibrionaceae bacterium]|nr:3-methyl-2-oxobutanoate hydroxymethyltransferase [Pseudobdellovibrionaceae bacterium]
MKSVLDFAKWKEQGKKISMVTCYDTTTAKLVNGTTIDCILVGDSLAMTMHGHADTLPATPELMALHVAAVRRGAPEKFIIGDMPFLAHRGSLDSTLMAVAKLMQAGAQAVKIEGIKGSESVLAHIVDSGVPVMGHLGLTPQSLHAMGGFKVQATDERAAEWLLAQARAVEQAGCFAVVLECVPSDVAKFVTENIRIPTIGIGAGSATSGQVLVIQDLLGLNIDFQPRFVRRYLDGATLVREALNQYDRDVKTSEFPSQKESY